MIGREKMDQRIYYRPVVCVGPRPSEALGLAGRPELWFSQVECLSRDRPARVVSLADVPEAVLSRLSTPRAPLCGLSMDRPRLMGILNVTPDSFSDGGCYETREKSLSQARRLVTEGADILDIGGESTRPGAETIPPDLEIARTAPLIETLCRGRGIGAPISIDTRKSAVAAAAFAAGAAMLNDVSALSFDPGMAAVVGAAAAPVCLMHSRGSPATMQNDPRYRDVLLDVYDHLEARIRVAEDAGIARTCIVVDPGIGFGKTLAHNLALIRGISLFHGLGCPLLLGVSRKGFIGRIGLEDRAERRAPGSIALGLEGLRQGVQLLRVHDIRETRQAVLLWQAVHRPNHIKANP